MALSSSDQEHLTQCVAIEEPFFERDGDVAISCPLSTGYAKMSQITFKETMKSMKAYSRFIEVFINSIFISLGLENFKD